MHSSPGHIDRRFVYLDLSSSGWCRDVLGSLSSYSCKSNFYTQWMMYYLIGYCSMALKGVNKTKSQRFLAKINNIAEYSSSLLSSISANYQNNG